MAWWLVVFWVLPALILLVFFLTALLPE